MKNFIKKYIAPIAVVCSVMLVISSCAKDDYYKDGGLANPVYNGTVLQYLQSNPKFDTIAKIIKLANLEDVFSKEQITFFAPTDEVIRRTIGLVNSKDPALVNKLNQKLFDANKDTIKVLSDVPSATWRRYLLKYVFKGKFLLRDYTQLDFNLRQIYPGGYYYGYNGDLAMIGVVFNTENSIKYAGYRQLSISSVPDPSVPTTYYAAAVASSDIQPSNGVVHALAIQFDKNNIGDAQISTIGSNVFGMTEDFYREVILNK